jgi:hypothetical protein
MNSGLSNCPLENNEREMTPTGVLRPQSQALIRTLLQNEVGLLAPPASITGVIAAAADNTLVEP